jgi:hypothetical protein
MRWQKLPFCHKPKEWVIRLTQQLISTDRTLKEH